MTAAAAATPAYHTVVHDVEEETAVVETAEAGQIHCHAAEVRERDAVEIARVREHDLDG